MALSVLTCLPGVRGAQARQFYIRERNKQAATLLQSIFRGVYVFTACCLGHVSDIRF